MSHKSLQYLYAALHRESLRIPDLGQCLSTRGGGGGRGTNFVPTLSHLAMSGDVFRVLGVGMCVGGRGVLLVFNGRRPGVLLKVL